MSLNLFIIGPSGCGKSTQAKLIASKYGLTHLSMGQILRDEMAAGTPEGLEAKSFVDSGNLVPEQLTFKLLTGKEGMGYGDVKYFAALGAWHGVCILPVLALTAALTAMSYLAIRKLVLRDNYAFKNPLPFGPFLAAAGLCASWQEVINLPL